MTTINQETNIRPAPHGQAHAAQHGHGKTVHKRKAAWKRQLAGFARWAHTYLSMFSFLILFFFAITGFTLNHAQWFDSLAKTAQKQGMIDPAWLKGDINKAEIIRYFQRQQAIKGAPGDFDVDDRQCAVSFKGPGYEADVNIDRASGNYQLTVARAGFIGVLNDLHKGRDSGAKWQAVIDVTAIGMALLSLTGLTLIFYLTKRRTWGLLALGIGAAACYLAYLAWVP